MNKAHFKKVLDQITAHPETWKQSSWHCDTQHCFAGYNREGYDRDGLDKNNHPRGWKKKLKTGRT